jgi:integrase
MITKRDTVYQVRIEIGRDASGKRQHAYATCPTLRDAQLAEAKMRLAIADGTHILPNRITVGEWLETWLAEYRPDVRAKQRERDEGIIRNHLVPLFGSVLLHKLHNTTIQKAIVSWSAQGYAPATVRTHHTTLHSALKRAVLAGLLQRNPADGCVLPRDEAQEIVVLTEDEQRRILTSLKDTEAYLPALVALTSGMRRGEVLGTRWQDVDFATATLRVRQELVATSGGLCVGPPKTRSSVRTLTMPVYVMEALQLHQMEQGMQVWSKSDLVFRTADGEPLHPNRLAYLWNRGCKRAGIAARFHDLRHTHASALIRDGASLKMVQARLGHSDASITLRIYVHLFPGMEEEAMAKINERMVEW